MGTKSVSRTLTVNTIQDGVSQPSYIQTQEAWSNQTTSASSSTMPSDCSESSWKDYTPTKDKTYLWRRSRTMTLNTSTRQYTAGAWSYQRLSGDNGTSISIKGHVDTVSALPSTHADGDAYVVDADGHLYMWSAESNSWIDIGLFQGEAGKTYYTHIAWATDTSASGTVPSPASGQTSVPNKSSVTGFSIAPFNGAKWMGVLVNQTLADSTTANLYTWSYTKGSDAVDYKISLAGSQFAVDPNDSGSEMRVNIVGKVYKIVGGVMSEYTDLTRGNLYLYFDYLNGDTDVISDFTVNGATFSTDIYDGEEWDDEQLFVAKLRIGGVEVASDSLQVVVYGENGQKGQRGKMSRNIYCAGKWSELTGNVQFEVTDYSAPYVDITENGTGTICKVYVGSNGTKTFPTTRNGYLNSDDWADMNTDFKYIIAQALFSSFAKLGSFVISGDYFISQYGAIYYNNGSITSKITINSINVSTLFGGKLPYAWFDDTDPMAETSPSTGNYKFVPAKCIDALTGEEFACNGKVHFYPDGSGSLAGDNITWNTGGSVSFTGTIRSGRYTENSQTKYANEIKSNGSGHLAKGNIEWNTSGTITVTGTINASGGKITGNMDITGNGKLTVGTNHKIEISPDGSTWGAKIVGLVGSTQYLSLGYAFANNVYTPELYLGDMSSNANSIRITDEKITQKIVPNQTEGYTITQGHLGEAKAGISISVPSVASLEMAIESNGYAFLRAATALGTASRFPTLEVSDFGNNSKPIGRVYAVTASQFGNPLIDKGKWSVLMIRHTD